MNFLFSVRLYTLFELICCLRSRLMGNVVDFEDWKTEMRRREWETKGLTKCMWFPLPLTPTSCLCYFCCNVSIFPHLSQSPSLFLFLILFSCFFQSLLILFICPLSSLLSASVILYLFPGEVKVEVECSFIMLSTHSYRWFDFNNIYKWKILNRQCKSSETHTEKSGWFVCPHSFCLHISCQTVLPICTVYCCCFFDRLKLKCWCIMLIKTNLISQRAHETMKALFPV